MYKSSCCSYIDICSHRNEELHHILLTSIYSVVQWFPPTFQGPVYIISLELKIYIY